MRPGDIEVVNIATNSYGVYFSLATGKGGQPASVKRTRSLRAGADGYTYWCATCGKNDDCEHASAAAMHYAKHGPQMAAVLIAPDDERHGCGSDD